MSDTSRFSSTSAESIDRNRRRICAAVATGLGVAGLGLVAPGALAAPKKRTSKPLTKEQKLRIGAAKLLDTLLPAPYGSKKYKENPYAPVKSTAPATCSPTNCYAFPAYYLYRLNGNAKVFKYPYFDISKELAAFPELFAAFRFADGKTKPKMGDVFLVHDSPTPNASVGHIGVIRTSNREDWTTGDYGQQSGDGVCEGWDGKITHRKYSVVNGVQRLSGPNGTNARALLGWLDISALPHFK